MQLRRDSCPFCRSTPVVALHPSIGVDRCQDCDLVFRNPLPSEEALTEHYGKAYSKERVERGTTEEAATSAPLAEAYTRKLLDALGLRDFRGLSLLEIGAGTGEMAEALQNAGARVVAVEPYATTFCRARGIETIRALGELEAGTSFDGIVAIEVLEHLSQPWQALAEWRQLLRPRGWLYGSTPNVEGLSARVTGPGWREFLKPDHLVFLRPHVLARMLRSSGYTDVRRLRWWVRYHRQPMHAGANLLLQLTGLEGSLRFLCRRPESSGR